MVSVVVGVHRTHMSRVVSQLFQALLALAQSDHGIPQGGTARTAWQAFWDLAGSYYSFTLICGNIEQHH